MPFRCAHMSPRAGLSLAEGAATGNRPPRFQCLPWCMTAFASRHAIAHAASATFGGPVGLAALTRR